MLTTRIPLAVTALLSVALSGCGGGSDDTDSLTDTATGGQSSSSLKVTPSLGQMQKATVKVFQSDTTTLLAEGALPDSGTIELNYSNYSGAMVVVVSGNDSAQYFDESASTLTPFASGNQLRAILPSGSTESGVTALTEAAYQLSASNSISLTDSNIKAINEQVRGALAPELSSILSSPTLFGSQTTQNSLDTGESDKYALRLAALAMLGSGNATPALTIAKQLAADLSDGTIDGVAGSSGNITDLVYTANQFSSDLHNRLANVASSYGTSALQSAYQSYDAIKTNLDLSGFKQGGVSGVSLPSTVAGQSVKMTFCCNNGSPYNNGDEVLFTFTQQGALELTEQHTQVASGATLDTFGQYIWTDSNGMKYLLSLNQGAIHEVNLMSASDQFLGQFSPSSQSGNGSNQLGSNEYGGVFTLNSSTVKWTTEGSSANENSAIAITGLGDERYLAMRAGSVKNNFQLRMIPINKTGTYTCGQGPNSYRLVGVWFVQNFVYYKAEDGISGSQCTIEVSKTGDVYEGTFEGTFVNGQGDKLTITKGKFRNDGSLL